MQRVACIFPTCKESECIRPSRVELACRSRSESPVRRTSRRRRSRSRSHSRSRNQGADMGDLTYEQYLEAFEKVCLTPTCIMILRGGLST